jgi:hypothetical protein
MEFASKIVRIDDRVRFLRHPWMTGRVVAIQADISFNGGQIVTVQCEDGSVRVAHRSFLEIWRP